MSRLVLLLDVAPPPSLIVTVGSAFACMAALFIVGAVVLLTWAILPRAQSKQPPDDTGEDPFRSEV